MSRKLLTKAFEGFDGDFQVMTPASIGGVNKPGANLCNAVKTYTLSDFNGFSQIAEVTGVMVDTGSTGKMSATYSDMKIKGDKLQRAFEDLDDAIAAFNVSVGIHEAINSEEKAPADQKVLDQVALSMGILKDGQSLGSESLVETLKDWFVRLRDFVMNLVRKLVDYAEIFFMSIKGSREKLEEMIPRLNKLNGRRKEDLKLQADKVPSYLFFGNELIPNVSIVKAGVEEAMYVLREAKNIAGAPRASFFKVNNAWTSHDRGMEVDDAAREVIIEALKTQAHEWASHIAGVFGSKIKIKSDEHDDTFYPTFSSHPYVGNYRIHITYPKADSFDFNHMSVDNVCEQFKKFDISLTPGAARSESGKTFEIPNAGQAVELAEMLLKLMDSASLVEDALKGETGAIARSWLRAESDMNASYTGSVSVTRANARPAVHIRLLASTSRSVLNNLKLLMDMTHRTTRPVMYVLNQTTLSYLKD